MNEENPKAAARTLELGEAIDLMQRLRAPGGCPWDREQTFDTIKRHTLEETYEVFDAIDRRDWAGLKDELGDLLLQVLFYSQIAEEAGYFSIEEVAANLNAKLIRRHPHIFGEALADSAEEVKRNWDEIKREEKGARGEAAGAYLDGVPRHLPAMLEAEKLGSRASKAGFDWPDVQGLFLKLAEEAEELRRGVEPGEGAATEAAHEELGDLLFTAVNLARHLRLEPEFALKAANAKFRRRFGAMEAVAGGVEELRTANAEELERQWAAVKQSEG